MYSAAAMRSSTSGSNSQKLSASTAVISWAVLIVTAREFGMSARLSTYRFTSGSRNTKTVE